MFDILLRDIFFARLVYLSFLIIFIIYFTYDYFSKFYEFLHRVIYYIFNFILPVVVVLFGILAFIYFGIQLFFVM